MVDVKEVDMVDEDSEIDFGFIAVDKGDFETLSELLDFEISDEGVFYDSEGDEIRCEESDCNKLITEDNLGSICRKGNRTVFYCDNPVCFTDFVIYLEEVN